MWKKNLLWAFALIGMLAMGTAYTVIVSSDAEATSEFAKGKNVVENAGCQILDISKTLDSAEKLAAQPITIVFALNYTVNGKQERTVKTIEVASESEAKAAVEIECEKMWAILQPAKQDEQKIVIVRYAEMIGQVYDLLTKNWTTKP